MDAREDWSRSHARAAYPADRDRRMLEMYLQGKKVRTIARWHGVSVSLVYHVLRKLARASRESVESNVTATQGDLT